MRNLRKVSNKKLRIKILRVKRSHRSPEISINVAFAAPLVCKSGTSLGSKLIPEVNERMRISRIFLYYSSVRTLQVRLYWLLTIFHKSTQLQIKNPFRKKKKNFSQMYFHR